MARGIEQIVNERVLQWEAEHRRRTPPPPSHVRQRAPSQRPIVTISRECGSLGGTIGRLVAKRLGFVFYSQELVHEIATRARVESEIVGSLDEQARGTVEVMVREILEGKAFAMNDYLVHLRRVVQRVGREGRGVVVGRASHLILDRALTLRVRTYADVATRIDNTMVREKLSRDLAAERVRRIDRERSLFYRKFFNVDWSDRSHFDLMLNTSTLPVDQCADIVASAFLVRFGSHSIGELAQVR